MFALAELGVVRDSDLNGLAAHDRAAVLKSREEIARPRRTR
jgi:hypothetical protein